MPTRLQLLVSPARVGARLTTGKRTLWEGEAAYDGTADLAEVIARLAVESDIVRPRAAVTVELERPLVQFRMLDDLPPVPEPQLRPLVEQQSHRYFRKNGKLLVVDAHYVNGARGKAVHLAAVEEPVVEAIHDGIRAAGLRLDDIVPAGGSNRLSLVPPGERRRRRQRAALSLRRLGIVTVGMWTIVGVLMVMTTTVRRRAVESELATLSNPVEALASVEREIAQGRAMLAAIEADEQSRYELPGFLVTLSDALPDSAFLTSLTRDRSGRGFLGGYARRASEVVAQLERSGAVTAPSLDGPPGRERLAGIEWERFSISFGSEQ